MSDETTPGPFELLFLHLGWGSKVRGVPLLEQVESINIEDPPYRRQLHFTENEFSIAIGHLGKLKERPGSRSARTLWLREEEGVKHVAVTRRNIAAKKKESEENGRRNNR